MATNVSLTPELERFARTCVEVGRYNNVSEVVRSGLRLLQEAEERRAGFRAMLAAVEAEADREGDFALDDVLAEVDEIIETSQQ
ncbi:Antitoxin ParD1 [Candidatus Terasakiella magnetica]|uniref:Putative transcriptional regulator, CopG/Arc/MetJ family protein n=1 Tax=Paramagnetospirillum caucaseum TaxID=1244869 RepID=M2Z527_9PROT|nr:type II toxin-antitoxin system ParD family antitoxin [Paramagnetospirillum caucaseum]EME69435.1 putative transcriptional regulator, CopG/Arc/MetJ family protein [Paramagnetospirillum caucaseum]CAA7626274.1 Antitoxin ParD1 [Candidatus Terasakiella magnetica]